MSKKLIAAAVAAAFALTAFQAPSFAKKGGMGGSPKPTYSRVFESNGGKGGHNNSGTGSGIGGKGGEITGAGKAQAGTRATTNGADAGNNNSGTNSGGGGAGGKISF